MQLAAFDILIIGEAGEIIGQTKGMVNMLTVTHIEKGPNDNLMLHVMSGRVVATTTDYESFVSAMQGRSNILVPRG